MKLHICDNTAFVINMALLIGLVFFLISLMTGCAIHPSRVANDCEIIATNYQEIIDARYELSPNFHSRILVVNYLDKGEMIGHAYCVWRAKGVYYAYDHSGTQRLVTGKLGIPSPIIFANQLNRGVVRAYYQGKDGPDADFEN